MELLVDHVRRHPIHVIKKGGNGVLDPRLGLLQALNQSSLEKSQTTSSDGIAKSLVVNLLQITRAAFLAVLSTDVPEVEVVVLDKISITEALENGDKIVLAMQPQFQLARGNSCQKCKTSIRDQLVDHPAHDGETELVPLALLMELVEVLVLNKSAADKAETEHAEDHPNNELGKHSRGSRVHEGLQARHLCVPKLLAPG
mmetsp:Transcript_77078/g.208130  ORF Transcript_77078/g.208130 Transcript_77078/m.208130 type:complete len:200 (-) Transcript_77078:430-1029(-)